MRHILRKTLSSITIFSLLIQATAFWIPSVYAAWDLTIQAVKNEAGTISNGGYMLMDPDTSAPSTQQGMRFDVQGKNTAGESIKNVFINVNFGNNTGFAYDGINLKSRINSIDVTNPLPASIYSAANGITAEITSAGTPTAEDTQGIRLAPVSAAQNISILPNINTYQNNVSVSITALTTATDTSVSSPAFNFTIYANVKPHITDMYFEYADGSNTTSTVQGAGAEAINLVVKVKDSNGSDNIAGGSVKADLSALGLGSAETLSYVSSSGNTATFKKTGIVTSASLGAKTIPINGIIATDVDGHTNDITDPYFASADRKTDLTLTIVAPAAPTVSLVSVSDNQIGGPLEPSSTVVFSSNQNGETKVVVGGDSLCSSGGTTLEDWTGSGSYTSGSQKSITINATSLASGANTVNLCMRNTGFVTGSISTTITKNTTTPVLSGLTYGPTNVTTSDASVTFSCNAISESRLELGGSTYGAGTFVASGSTVAGGSSTLPISNALLSNGSNVFKAYCRDGYGNTSSGSTVTINKTPPTPAMTGTASLADNDIDIDGLDGRDVSITWDTSAWVGFGSYFESYRLYLLPAGTPFSTGATMISLIPTAASGSFVGTSTLTKDSLGNTLVSGAQYTTCIAIMGTSGLLGTQVCSPAATLTADTVAHPTIVSARFTSDTNLEVTTNATLDTTLSTHSGGLFTYTVGGTPHHPSAVASVNAKKINLTIPSLGSTAAVGILTTVGANALHAAWGGYNIDLSPATSITDGQAPTISAFSKSTAAIYGNFYKGSLAVSYTFNEAMATDGSTRLEIVRTSGTADSTTHRIDLTTTADTSAGAKNKTIDLNALSLVSGTIYQIRLVGNDAAGNTATAQTISSIGYDAAGPSAPVLSATTTLFGTLTPLLSWAAAVDNGGNGSGLKSYTLTVYSGNSCTPSAVRTYNNIDPLALSYTLATALPTDKSTYSWTLQAIDNLDNTGSVSTCGAFSVDTSVPVISNATLKDTILNSSSWGKIGNTITLTANIANTDASHIWADLSLLTGNGGDTHVACSAPGAGITCSYVAGVVTYSFTIGSVTQNVSRIATLAAQNTVGINDTSANASITIDSTAPGITASTITSPNGGEIWWGTTRTITWNSSHVTDAGGIVNIALDYSSNWGSSWTPIANVPNTGSYTWNISSLTSGSNYLVRITAIDNAGNTASDVSNAVFSIDLSKPTVAANTITSPNGGEVWKGGIARTISWNPSSVSDNIALAASPITLEYSPDNGASWNAIASNLPNSGSYAWTTPSGNISTAKIRLTASDVAGNVEYDVSDAIFAIDSTNPNLSVTYAGGGGSTPQNGRKINNSGVELSAGATDAYLQTVSYIFRNATDSLSYVDGSGWMGGNVSNIFCADGTSFGTSNNCANPAAAHITPTIENGKTYELIFSATDEAGNITNSITHTYIGDTAGPVLTATSNAQSGYFSWALLISGTASDAGTSVGSVTIKIQKGTEYWDGTVWTTSPTELLVSTSDSYAHYSYTFTPSATDADESAYTITVTASDTAYKTPNTSTQSLSATLDKNGPTIASDVFTFDTATLRKGSQSMNVTWNPAKITTSGAPLATNPVTLSYNLSGSIVQIATGLPNSGSYSFTLPVVDTNAGHIIISAKDTLGNIAPPIASSAFVVDSTPPSITSVETADFDANGAIDGLIVTTSENVNTTGINLGDFTVSDGITLTSLNASDLANVTKIELHFTSNFGNTASLPKLSYSGTSIHDIAENNLVAFSNRTSTDSASPRLLSAAILDSNTNGKVDTINATFSEPLSATTNTSAWSINNPLAWVSIASVSISGNIAAIHLNEPTAFNTSTGSMTLGFTANSNYKDASGNIAGSLGSPASLQDSALPQVISVATADTNANGKIDKITASFSENVSGNDSGWVISGLATGSSYAGGAVASGNSIAFTVNETSLASDSSTKPTLAYTPGNIQDSSSNPLASFASKTASDGVAPIILSRKNSDTDGNGRIDHITLQTSETLSGSTASMVALVASHTVSGLTLSGTDIIATISEGTDPDTGDTPSIQLTSIGNVGDTAWNLLATEWSATASSDGTGPIISTARYDFGATASVSDDIIYVTFSEPIDTASLTVSDFSIHNGGALGSATLTNITTTSAEIHLAANSTAFTPGTSTLSLVSGSVLDAGGNASPTEGTQNRIVVLPPVIINEIMWSSYGSSASQYIELHNLGNSAIDMSGWKIKNAWGNGVDITIPASTSLAGGGYYLITRNTPGSGGSELVAGITSDLTTTSLALSASQNALILQNASAVVFDQAKANAWSAGSGSTLISMERNTIAGNGLNDVNWHDAVVNRSAFSLMSALGTPRAANESDGTAPTLSAVSAQNTLSPAFSNDIVYTINDNYSVNWPSFQTTLEKWNGSAWTSTGTATASTGTTTTIHTTVGSYGKYRLSLQVADPSGNIGTATHIFYVDSPTIQFSTGAVAMGNLSSSAITTSTPITITIKTVGAGVSIASQGDGFMSLSGGTIESIGAWNGSMGYGIDYDVITPSGAGNITTTGIPKITPTTIFSNLVVSPDTNGALQTYTMHIQYMGKVDDVTAAGLYKAVSSMKFDFNY